MLKWLASPFVKIGAIIAAIGGAILYVFMKGKASGKRGEREKNRKAFDDARERQDEDAQDIDRMPDSDLDDQLRQR